MSTEKRGAAGENAVAEAKDIVSFWQRVGRERWFKKDDALDAEIRRRFLATYEAAVTGRLAGWQRAAESTLALVIVLDQFPRNMFRNDPRTYAADPLAREIATKALAQNFDRAVPADLRAFFFLPFMHSENLADQERCVALYRAANDADGLKWAEEHADIIRRFGRFPHRNKILGRTTTAEEAAFLNSGGFAG